MILCSFLKVIEDENNKIDFKMDYNFKFLIRVSRFFGLLCFIECILGEREYEVVFFMGNKIIRKF